MSKKLFDMPETEIKDHETDHQPRYIAVLHSTNNIIARGNTFEEVGRNAAPWWPKDELVAPYYITEWSSFTH